MKKDVKLVSAALKTAYISNKDKFKIKKTVQTLQFLKFLKEKKIINTFELHSGAEATVYLNISNQKPLVVNAKIMVLNHHPVFMTYNELMTNASGEYALNVFSTSYGLMDQHDLKKSKIGGILLCKIFLN